MFYVLKLCLCIQFSAIFVNIRAYVVIQKTHARKNVYKHFIISVKN